MLTIGHAAPEVYLTTTTGESVSMAETWRRGQHTLLVFLRHLG